MISSDHWLTAVAKQNGVRVNIVISPAPGNEHVPEEFVHHLAKNGQGRGHAKCTAKVCGLQPQQGWVPPNGFGRQYRGTGLEEIFGPVLAREAFMGQIEFE